MGNGAAVEAIELVTRATIGMTARALAEAAPRLDLSLLQWRALLVVGDDPGGARVGRVGEGVGVPLPAASRLVRRLQRRGLVDVDRDPDDGRATRVRLTPAGSNTRSAVLARRHDRISEALGQTDLSAEAVQGLRVLAESLERMSRKIPAQGTGLTGGPERGTMNESDSRETIKTGSFASGEEQTPDKDAEDRALHRGSFATGQELTPEQDAEERIRHSGSFALGEEHSPEKDAADRTHPGTFADTEKQD